MLSRMQEISVESDKLMRRKLDQVLKELDRQIDYWTTACESDNEDVSTAMENRLGKPNVFHSMLAKLERDGEFSTSYNEWDDFSEEDVEVFNGGEKMKNSLLKLRKDILLYCSQIPVLGFNSGNYDLNLIKEHLGSFLATDSSALILKKNNQYTCISNRSFRFLDVSQYLPPGTSYDQILKTFGVTESKGYFCFEYLDCLAKLTERELPPMSAFWSSLRNKNTLEDDAFAEFNRRCIENPNRVPHDVAVEMGLKTLPRSKEENYESLKQTWVEEGMTTLKDLLVYYNNKDVRLGIIAISRLRDFYFREMSVDIFKSAVSAPGVARTILFRSATRICHAFASIDTHNRDLFETIQANIIGRPSIIFCRYQKANETLIRKNPKKICRSCVGYDANALYVYCLGLDMPVSYFVRWHRTKTGAFKRDLSEKYTIAYDWFVTTNVSFRDIGGHMQDFVKSRDHSTGDRTLLIGGMRARRLLLASPLLKWYLDHGLVVSKVHQAVEFGRAKCFKPFADMITDARRLGDVDPDKKVLAELNKLIGNSAYGGLLMQKQKYRSCSIIQGVHKAKLRVNNPHIISLSSLSNDNFEVIMAKRRTTLDLPSQIGYFVLQYAKLRMLEFYYDFLCVYVDRSDFQLCQMDTDSLYFAISGETLFDVVRDEKKAQYKDMLEGFCNRKDIDFGHHFLPRTCCAEHILRDKRTPGLFKLECSGRELVSLNSKTYAMRIDDENEKVSSKGLNKRRIANATDLYSEVLRDKKSRCVVNNGFRARSNTMYTYEQKRWGLTYFYFKRVVQDDGVSTEPLQMELYPAKLNK